MSSYEFEDQIDLKAVEFIKEESEKEHKRLKTFGLIPLVIKVKNFGLTRKDEKIINRIELSTKFNFEDVKEIFISPPINYPFRHNFKFSNLVLMTENTKVPLLIPYLYEDTAENDLKRFLFINENLVHCLHEIN